MTVKARNLLTTAAAVAAACAVLPAGASAGLRGGDAPAVALPGDVSAAGVDADPNGWIVGARPGKAAARIARSHGARHVAGGAWLTTRADAAALAADLRRAGLLAYAEPDRYSTRAQAPAPDPLSAISPWRDRVVDPALVPPAVSASGPLIALVDSQLDISHEEFATGNITTTGGQALTDFHGTATAAVAAAAANGVGNLGVYPGARALNVALPPEIRCSDSARQIAAARRAGAKVINMSYGSPNRVCRRVGRHPARRAGGHRARGRRGQRVRPGQPARVPGEPAARADGGGAGRRRPAHVLLERERRGRPLGTGLQRAHGRAAATRHDVRRRWERGRLRPRQRHLVLGPDGRRRGRVDPGGAPRPLAGPGAERAPLRRARHRRPRLPVGDGLRDPLRRRRARTAGAAVGPGGAQRRHPLRQRPGLRLRRRSRSSARTARRPASPRRPTSPRTRSTSTRSGCARGRARRSGSARRSATRTSTSTTAGPRPSSGAKQSARSRKRERATDTVTVRNRKSRAATFFVAVGFTRGKQIELLNAAYELRVSR